MSPILKYIEVENFKSFRDRCVIGPLQAMNAVVGSNGSGKSNFMDAISFVMGEKAHSLRAKRLSDLIHGAVINRAVSTSASVTAVFTFGDNPEKEMAFRRSVQGSSSEYKIDENIVTANDYLLELKKLKINVKAKNFLVFQGEVESLAIKNPKEITALFEGTSGSGALKDEYDECKKQMEKTHEEIGFAVKKKKELNAERIEAYLAKAEADKYKKLKGDLDYTENTMYDSEAHAEGHGYMSDIEGCELESTDEKLLEHQLFKAFHNERAIKICEQELKPKQKELEKIEKKKEKLEDILKEKKKEHGKYSRDLAKIEQEIREAEVEVSKKKPMFIKAKEKVTHFQKKVESAGKNLDQAKKAHDAHLDDIKKLEEQIKKVEKSQEEYEKQIVVESQSQGRDVQLEDAQLTEYHRLKEKYATMSARYTQELDSVNREQKSDQDRLDNMSRLRTDAQNKHLQKCHEKEEMKKRIKKLEEHIRTSEQALNDQKKLLSDLDVGASKNKVQEVEKQLEGVLEQLGDARTDKYEDMRGKKKQEIINKLKETFPGVLDRMVNICHPIDRRFNVAITKVLGKHMEAIVVDTEHTASECIKYLKREMLGVETFLPLTGLLTKPINERLRNIPYPKGVRLVYYVLTFNPDIATAVQFATNNALVCESPEDASKVAYELDKKYDAVALDGTYYRKSGIISGGSVDLARKAKRWEERDMSQLEAQKKKLTDELREALKTTRKESEINTVKSQIRGLETRLKYARGDMETTKAHINAVDKEIVLLDKNINRYGPEIEAIEEGMRIREQQIEEIKLRMNTVEDEVFSDFCKEIGVKNIRHYEDRELRTGRERNQKRLEFNMQINRITSTLEFERSRDTQNNVSRWEKTMKDEEEQLEIAKKQEAKQRDGIEKAMKKLDEHKAHKMPKNKDIEKMDEQLGKLRRELGAIAKDAQDIRKSTLSIESKLERLKGNRHATLLYCTMYNIDIPMLVGDLDDIIGPVPSSTYSTESSTAQHEREARIQIDYSTLSDNLKELVEKDAIKNVETELVKAINSIQDTLQEIKAPNMKALEKVELAQRKLQSNNKEFENLRNQNQMKKAAFDKIKQLRYEKFRMYFDCVAKEIDTIYKSMARNPSAQALLVAQCPEEPYLRGIDYNCVVPGKRFQPMSNLSGGEKTVAALALLFAIHSYQPAPFLVLDEVDAALDNTNIVKVSKFISQKTESLQVIVISHKKELYSHADVLIGLCPQPKDCLISKVLTLDLTEVGT